MAAQTKQQGSGAGVNPPEARGLVLGTAGHIDHGKTALIGALTGTQTDRLPEEKARGITIDLGFAALDLPGFGRLSVVDVPGHEGLVRTMVSGASGIDMLLLVVAADESVMPQTREHVAICDLLGIETAVVALTKTDLADEEMIELSSEEISELLASTRLAGAPIVPVSSQTGVGLDALRSALMEAAQGARPRTPRNGPPRLGVDRVFAMRGFGTVVTGTLIGAPLHLGDRIEIQPSGLSARIRGLQSHGQESESAAPGTRCAVNLQGLEVADLRRGDVVTHADRLAATLSADVHLYWLATSPAADAITSVEVLVGTAERRAHLAAIGKSGFVPGEDGFARLHIDGEALALLPGDRFIVRGFAKSATAGATVGGGIVLDCAPPPATAQRPCAAERTRTPENRRPRRGTPSPHPARGLLGMHRPRPRPGNRTAPRRSGRNPARPGEPGGRSRGWRTPLGGCGHDPSPGDQPARESGGIPPTGTHAPGHAPSRHAGRAAGQCSARGRGTRDRPLGSRSTNRQRAGSNPLGRTPGCPRPRIG